MDCLQTSCCFCSTGLKNHTDVWFVFLPAVPVETRAPAILFSAGTFILLGLVTVGLLGHLLIFHIYLSKYYVPVLCIPISFELRVHLLNYISSHFQNVLGWWLDSCK